MKKPAVRYTPKTDRRSGLAKHNVMNHAYGVIKTFMLCQYESGTFKSNIETTEIGLFDRTSLPNDLAIEKTTKDQILMCFDFYEKPDASTLFD